MPFNRMKAICCAVALAAAPALAAAQPNLSMVQDNSSHIGRILVGGRDICTGTLVTPSIVLTAGHCLQPEGASRPITDTRVKFLIKSPKDGKRRLFSVRDIGMVPEFSYRSALNPGVPTLGGDMALLKLEGIATRTGHERIGDPTAANGLGTIPAEISHDRSPQGTESCLTRTLEDDIMVLSCHREEGFSGSPVFSSIEGERRIVGVVTARSERAGVPVLYAAIPHLRIDEIIWQKMRGDHQVKMISSSSSQK